MGVVAQDTTYTSETGILFSVPCVCTGNWNYEIVKDVKLSEYALQMLKNSNDELVNEKNLLTEGGL